MKKVFSEFVQNSIEKNKMISIKTTRGLELTRGTRNRSSE